MPLKLLPIEEFEKRQKSIKMQYFALTENHIQLKQRSDEMKIKARTLKEGGNQLFRNGRYVEAEKCYSEALKIHPGCRILWTNRAICRNTMGKFAEALSDCNSALTIDPKCSKSIVQKGNAFFKSGQIDQARECYESLRMIDENDLADTYLKKFDA